MVENLAHNTKILVVDVDNSLIKTDLLFEAMLKYVKLNWQNIFYLTFAILSMNKVRLKKMVAEKVSIEPENLPFRNSAVSLIMEKKKAGYKIIIASASPEKWILPIANHLDFFDFVSASKDTNLKGLAKYEELEKRFGLKEFEYLGDSTTDIPIWQKCGTAILVNPSSNLEKNVKKVSKVIGVITDQKNPCKVLLKQLRIHQWAKNTLIFLPLILAHKFEQASILMSLLAFVSFSLGASSVYLMNDISDIDADRAHHKKRSRPIACGDLGIGPAIAILFTLLILSLIVGNFVGDSYLLVLIGYLLANILYTFKLKKEVVLDVILLSSMYAIRILAGAVAIGVFVSQWLFSFAMFFFFSLACVKRYTEISKSQNKLTIDGRGYRRSDGDLIMGIGVSSGLVAILVFLLYLQSPSFKDLYKQQEYFFFISPVLLYWIARVWFLSVRNELNDDPVVFAIRDKTSWICFVIVMGIFAISI
jgi:4-hydroxybenzoate polyprenyltransferase/phosphoserine phosphatase